MCLANRFLIASGKCWRWQRTYRLAALACAVLLTGCSKGVDQFVQGVVALTDKHESLYNQMLDCEQRYASLLAEATDLESIERARPQMVAEAKKYKELGDQFLKTQGLTPEKLRGILDRTRERRQSTGTQIKEQMQRLTSDGTNNLMRLAIPHLEWSAAQLNFAFDADAVAQGKKTHKGQMADQMEAAKARMQTARDDMKAQMEKSRARAEEMRSKMRGGPFGPGGRSTP